MHWQNAQHQDTRWASAEIRTSTSTDAPPAEHLWGRHSAEQPDASSPEPAHRVLTVHGATHANHAEYMAFMQLLLSDFYDIWHSLSEPKAKRASWSSQWNNMTRILEAIARDVATNNCYHGLDSSLRSVVQPASVEHISGASALLLRKSK